MSNRTLAYVVALLLLAFGLGIAAYFDRKLDVLTTANHELILEVKVLVQTIKTEKLNMADVNLSDGNSALNHATTIEWSTTTQTVKLVVYKNASDETAADYRKQVTDATDKYQQVYPPAL